VIERKPTGPIALNTCYVAQVDIADTAHAIVAVFNSFWAAILARLTADEAQAGYRRINARVASAFPIPRPGPATDRLISFSRQAHDYGHITAGDLDDAVADALDLPATVRRSLRDLAPDFRTRPSRRTRTASLVAPPG
jgi:hypothetical protein